MPPKYRTIPAAEVEYEGGAFSSTNNIESFELEDSFTIVRTDRSLRRKFACIVACLLVLFVGAIGYGVHESRKSPQQEASANDVNSVSASSEQEIAENEDAQSASDDEINIKQQPTVTPKLIYCYGDSLTYGMVPSSREAYPYAPYLEQELNNFLYKNSMSTSQSYKNNNATIVKHFGFPGWTATNMLDHINDANIGICDIIQNNLDITLMIILVGTNDIGTMVNSDEMEDVARTIVNSIIELHNRAFTCANNTMKNNFHTLALGIPGSAFQEQVPIAAELATSINKSIKEFASSDEKISYIDFPVPYEKNGSEWGRDGLHMSPEGYTLLGKLLAPHVELILDSIDL